LPSCSANKEEKAEAIENYEPTDEAPEPDWKWICEETAMNRLAIIDSIGNMTVTDATI